MRAPTDGYGMGRATRRKTALILTATVHMLGFLVLLTPGPPPKQPAGSRIATFDSPVPSPPVPAPPKAHQPKKIPPRPPRPIVLPPPLIELEAPSPIVAAMLEQADAQAAGGGCDLTGPVQAALRESVAVQEGLPSIPPERRSVANAIAIWNQTWVQPDPQLSEEVLSAIRTTVATTIERASDSCRLQSQGGPRLIFLTGANATTVLALGSGEWTWQQVADSAHPDFAPTGDATEGGGFAPSKKGMARLFDSILSK